ncbi:MAG TPA: SRPBCC family protein [Aquihabitans sp.]|jgi:uncharacterized protein YndB with AHSA1/START domain|nr:SRPBCC family protein [Aquihabitans sp.]
MSDIPGPPTGHVRQAADRRELVIERTFAAPVEDVWASLTEPERVARWYGTMEGEPGPGRTIMVTMTAEVDAAPEPATIRKCEPPRRVVLDLGGEAMAWRVAVDLEERDGRTVLTFVQALADDVDVADVGPGWEYYADRLTAALTGRPMPDWEADGYLARLGPHYAPSPD